MHVVHVIRDLDSASGGPSRSLPALVRALARVDPPIEVAALYQDRGQAVTINVEEEHDVRFLPIAGGKSPGPFRVRKCLEGLHRKNKIDLIHLHGLWSPSISLSAGFARRVGIPYLISPRGMLSTWCLNNKSVRKRVAWWSYQHRDLSCAACIHATSHDEAHDIRSTRLSPPIAIIPHGCELPPEDITRNSQAKESGSKLAVCITRIHPVKGLSELIDAWADVRPADWQLIIAGPDTNGYGDRLREQIKHHQINNVELIDAVDSNEKWALLSQADLFVSASHSENFGMSIAEALATATPVVTTRGTPWQEIVDHQCGWWVDVGVEGLTQGIRDSTSSSALRLSEMGQRGSALIRTQYAWPAIGNRMADAYRWLLKQSDKVPEDSDKVLEDIVPRDIVLGDIVLGDIQVGQSG